MDGFDICGVTATEIVDGRLDPTLRVSVETSHGAGRADVPCGRSRGEGEAVELRDGDGRYFGRGVGEAVDTVETVIAPELVGRDVTAQRTLDDLLVELDGTPDKSNLGANTTTGVSLAVLRAASNSYDIPLYRYVGGVDAADLPVPFFDLIEGGKLGESGLPFQEHQVIPVGAGSIREAVRLSAEVYEELGRRLAERYGKSALGVGDEGGYTPADMTDPRAAFDLELEAIEELGYGDEFVLGADVAASHFYEGDGKYDLGDGLCSRDELFALYEELVDTYPLRSLEDPFVDSDVEAFAELTDRLDIQIVGDDLFVTDPERVRDGVEEGAATTLLMKVNQVGTVSEALDAARLARRNGLGVQVSERSGQTPDTWLADLAVGVGAGQIKTGVTRGERTEQYNRLFAIEDELGRAATFGRENEHLA